jgi:hypothetical protein
MGLAQTAANKPDSVAQDTLKAGSARTGTLQDRPARPAIPDSLDKGEEMELESIAIEAVIEKPNVDIIPKRAEPDFEELEFVERSFERELRQIPKDLLLVDDELDRAARLEGLKKLLEKKKKD